MPDAWKVEQQFVTEIAKILTAAPYQPYSVGMCDQLGLPFRLMRGWPVDQQLVKDLRDPPQVTNITVFSQPGQRNTTRFLRRMMIQMTEQPEPSMLAEIVANQVRFFGTGSANEVMSVAYGGRAGVAIRLTDDDTPQSVAIKFCQAGLGPSDNGVLTLPVGQPVSVAFGCDATLLQEVHRQCGIWRVTVWSNDVYVRDKFCDLIDPNLQALDRFFFDDHSCSGPIIGAGFFVEDNTQKEGLWKRTLMYETEYPTDYILHGTPMVLGAGTLNDHPFFATWEGFDQLIFPESVSTTGIAEGA